MNNNAVMIKEAKNLIKLASVEFTNAYHDLCGTSSANSVLSVLDGQLRIASQLEQLVSFFESEQDKPIANEYELKKFLNSES